VHISNEKCDACGRCIDVCPVGALRFDGRIITAENAVELLMEDEVFFGETGGVTLSGGELFAQWRFALEILAECKKLRVNTAVETSLYVSPEILERFIPCVDHFIVDIKLFDSGLHRRIIGVDNALIMANFVRLTAAGADILVRTPLIPGFTDDENNIRAIVRYLIDIDPNVKYELLNYNALCENKYRALERPCPVNGRAFSDDEMERFYAILRQEGVKHIVRE